MHHRKNARLNHCQFADEERDKTKHGLYIETKTKYILYTSWTFYTSENVRFYSDGNFYLVIYNGKHLLNSV